MPLQKSNKKRQKLAESIFHKWKLTELTKLAETNLVNEKMIGLNLGKNNEFCDKFTYSPVLHFLALWQPYEITTCFASTGEKRETIATWALSKIYSQKETSFDLNGGFLEESTQKAYLF